jgi:hypothetical protein
MIRRSALRPLALALLALAASACARPLPDDLATVDAARAVVAAVQAKLGTKDVTFHRFDLEHDKMSVRVVDPKDPRKILDFEAVKGELVGPSPVTRAGDTTSEVIGVKAADFDLAGLAKAETACRAKLGGQPTAKLSLWDGVDIVHHERGPQMWIVRVKDDKFCRASLAGVIDFP